GVGTDQDVLPVVQPKAMAGGVLQSQGAGPATPVACGFDQGDLMTFLAGLHGSRQACPASADHQDLHRRPSACTFQASQNLRSGVRLTRCVSTSIGSAAISCSKVR